MSSEIHFLNSEEAARVLGVNVSSIKRWTDEGKLECIRTIGGHRKFQLDHLGSFLDKNKKKASKLNVFTVESSLDLELNYQILKGNFEYLRSYIITQAIKSNRVNVQKVLTALYLSQYALYQIYDNLLTPVLHEIGNRWRKNKLSIIEEHIAAQIIRDAIIRLQGIITLPSKKIGSALCLNLSSELHDISLKMVQNILELRGFKTYYSGQKTPYFDLEQMLTKLHLDRLYIASTMIMDIDENQEEINVLYNLCENNSIGIFVGGTGFDKLDYSHPSVVRRLNSFEEVQTY